MSLSETEDKQVVKHFRDSHRRLNFCLSVTLESLLSLLRSLEAELETLGRQT